MTIFWIYVVIQLVSTAYGVTVINSARRIPALRKRLRDAGYTQRDKDSLYKFNDWLKYFFKGFIPFYYAYKALELVNSKGVTEYRRMIWNNFNEIEKAQAADSTEVNRENSEKAKEEERAAESLAYDPNAFRYEEVGPYKARKIDLNEIYDEEETPIEYITREFEKDSSNKITPFVKDSAIYLERHDDEDDVQKPIEIEKPDIVEIKDEEEKKPSVSNSDIAQAISELSEFELKELSDKLLLLAENKKNKQLSYEKDVA